MANVTTTITLCDVPITPTNQVNFLTKATQISYFGLRKVIEYPKCKYQDREGIINVKGYVDKLQNCNYGFYTNTYNGNTKTFYFWIVAKNFLARDCTELTIQIDVFQTWLFDWYLPPCMIENMHVVDDTIGVHTFPEDFELGEYITTRKKNIDSMVGDVCYFVAVTDSDIGFGSMFGKTYSGFALKYYDEDSIGQMSLYIENLAIAGKADSIAFIFTFPKSLLGYVYADGTFSPNAGDIITGISSVIKQEVSFDWEEQAQNFFFNGHAYTPYNNKLYTYPYNFVTIKNPSGGNVVLKLENFEDITDIKFYLQTVVSQNPKFTLTPIGYCGKGFAIDDSIECGGFGLCSWNNDNYSNWFANNQNSISAQSSNANASYSANSRVNANNYGNRLANNTANMAKGVINTSAGLIGNLAGGNVAGAITGGMSGGLNTAIDYGMGVTNANNDVSNSNLMNTTDYKNMMRSIVGSVKDAQVQPNTCKGDTSACGLDIARGTNSFYIEQTTIKPEYAKIIDMQFQMFGYQVNAIEEPKLRTRSKWNYLKTVNCNVTGNIPQADRDLIADMFNNGITMWHGGDTYMYNYDTTNTIIPQ